MSVVAVGQLRLAVGDVDGNLAAAAAAVEQAAATAPALVVLPELCDSGYVFSSADEARGLASRPEESAALRQWQSLARAHDTAIVGGFCELGDDGRLYNSAALVDGSGVRAVYRKAHLWDAEHLIFTPGGEPPPVVEVPAGRVAVMICYDLEFPEWVRLAALAGADLIAAPVNWPAVAHPPGERPAEVIKAQAGAAVNGVYVAVADRCGPERGVGWVGGSMIVGPGGYPLAGPAAPGQPAVLTADCDLPAARDKRITAHNDLLADRRPDLYGPADPVADPAAADPPALPPGGRQRG